MKDKVGYIYVCLTPYQFQGKTSLKARPIVLIAQVDDGDYTALPISRVTKKEKIDPDFDIPVTMQDYPNLHLNADSYIRTNKVLTVNNASLNKCVSDLKTEYSELYSEVINKFEEFTQSVVKKEKVRI